MATFKALDDSFAVSAQISLDDVHAAAQQGFKHIVCNRPDNEDPGQPDFADISATASKLGLSSHHIPFDNTSLSPAVIDAMQDTLAALDGPVLAYCRSGTRCSIAWSALQRRAGHDMAEIEASTSAAGYALEPQRGVIEALSE
ncbi:MAG: TIGR01244 family sulfur transferase [Pseudomonadota bacterium]